MGSGVRAARVTTTRMISEEFAAAKTASVYGEQRKRPAAESVDVQLSNVASLKTCSIAASKHIVPHAHYSRTHPVQRIDVPSRTVQRRIKQY